MTDLWARWQTHRDRPTRDALIVHYADLVKYVASRVAAGLPQSVDQNDLVSYGIFGLIDAIEKFDPDRGYKFETYALARVKGAILDELRSIDWVPRSIRAKARAIDKATVKLEAELHRQPTEDELAGELDVPVDQLQDTLAQVALAGIAALDESVGTDEPLTLGDTIADTTNPAVTLEVEDLRRTLGEATTRMPEREHLVLTLYYHEGLTLAEIGQVLGVTESRVCQIHTKAIQFLRNGVLAYDMA